MALASQKNGFDHDSGLFLYTHDFFRFFYVGTAIWTTEHGHTQRLPTKLWRLSGHDELNLVGKMRERLFYQNLPQIVQLMYSWLDLTGKDQIKKAQLTAKLA